MECYFCSVGDWTGPDDHTSAVRVVYDDENYTAVSIEDLKGQTSLFILSNTDASASTEHELTIDGRSIEWSGPFHYAGL